MDPASGGARRGRQHVDERGRVVVGDPLALVDRRDREGRRADRFELLRRSGPSISSQAATSTWRIASNRAWSDHASARASRV